MFYQKLLANSQSLADLLDENLLRINQYQRSMGLRLIYSHLVSLEILMWKVVYGKLKALVNFTRALLI